jgi:hypothetical protein
LRREEWRIRRWEEEKNRRDGRGLWEGRKDLRRGGMGRGGKEE